MLGFGFMLEKSCGTMGSMSAGSCGSPCNQLRLCVPIPLRTHSTAFPVQPEFGKLLLERLLRDQVYTLSLWRQARPDVDVSIA